jgi:hypothetical protein
MRNIKSLLTVIFSVCAAMVLILGCDKIVHPALGSYPKDAGSPTGPLNFYAAFDGILADSIRATFPSVDSATSYTAGIAGKAVQFNPVLAPGGGASTSYSYIVYPNPNNFGTTASFSANFWINCPLANKDNNHADGLLSWASTSNFWGEMTWYVDNTDGGASDSMDLKVHFANGNGDNWDYANYVHANRWPHMYDGNWHMVTFTYDASAQIGTMYRDGVQFDQKPNETISFDGNGSNLIVGGYEEANNIQGNYSGNTWMGGFTGAVDHIRLYSSVLAASDVAALYANKQ